MEENMYYGVYVNVGAATAQIHGSEKCIYEGQRLTCSYKGELLTYPHEQCVFVDTNYKNAVKVRDEYLQEWQHLHDEKDRKEIEAYDNRRQAVWDEQDRMDEKMASEEENRITLAEYLGGEERDIFYERLKYGAPE